MNDLPPGDESPFPWTRLLGTALVLAVFIAGVSGTTIAAVALHGIPKHEQVLDVHAVSDGSAIVLWKDDAEDDWLSRYDVNGERWRQRVPGEARYISADGTGLGVGSDYAVVQHVHPARLSYDLFAVELETGDVRWDAFVESPPFHASTHERHPIAENMSVVGDTIVIRTDRGWSRIRGDTGQTIDVLVDDSLRREVWNGELRLRHTPRQVAVNRITYGTWCTLGEGEVHVDLVTTGERTVHVLRVSDDAGAHDVAVPDDIDHLDACAEYDGKIVLYSSDRFGSDRGVRLTVMTASGNVVHDIRAPGNTMFGTLWNRGANVYSGSLPRFLIVTAYERESGRTEHVIDLEQGVIARSTSGDDSSLLRVGSDWFRTSRKWSNASLVQLIDGRSGHLTRELAVTLGASVELHQVAGGSLWLFSRHRDELTLVRIELATMRVDFKRGRLWVASPPPE